MSGPTLFLATLGVAFLSGFIPFVNIEAYLLTVVVVGRPGHSLALILASTLGQMTAKCMLYYSGQGLVKLPFWRQPKSIEQLSARLTRRPLHAALVLFVSALTGLPPFYALSITAGALRVPFAVFAIAGFLGRLLRFSLCVWAPQLIMKHT